MSFGSPASVPPPSVSSNYWTGPPGWALQISRSTGKRYWQKGSVSWWHDSSLPAGWAWGQASSDGPRFWVELATGVRRDSPPTAVSAALLAPAKSSAPAPADVQSPPPSKRARMEDEAKATSNTHVAAAAAAAGACDLHFIVYPDYRGDLIVSALQRRSVWVDALSGAGPSERGFWRRLEAAVVANEWNFIWKPTVNFHSNFVAETAWRRAGAGTFIAASPHYDSGTSLHSLPLPTGEASRRQQLVNRMPQPRAISSKSNMYRSLSCWYGALPAPWRSHPAAVAVPTTFLVRSGDVASIAAFRRRFALLLEATSDSRGADGSIAGGGAAAAMHLARAGERTPAVHCAHNMWIIKPDHLFAGRGIELAASLADIESFLSRVDTAGLQTAEGSRVAAGAMWVVQKYIERPLLLSAPRASAGVRKFDVRVNVLVTDAWDVYVHREAFCRTSSSPYSLPGARAGAGAGAGTGALSATGDLDKAVHVTNNCYQVTAPTFGAHEAGNILSMAQLQAYLNASHGVGSGAPPSVVRDLFPRWVELILDVLCAARAHCVAAGAPPPRSWFDMLGFDFLVDEHLRSWLIEGNTNPSIDFHSPYTDALFTRMLEEMLRLTLDTSFPPPQPPAPLPATAFELADGGAPPAWLAGVDAAPPPTWWRAQVPEHVPAATAAAGVTPLQSRAPPPETDAAHAAAMQCWDLVWSERTDPRAIPHQAAMAPDALNGAAVEELLCAEAAAGVGGVSDADAAAIAARHGLTRLLHAVISGAGGSAGGSSSDAPTAFWRPALRRFIRRRDVAWLYPRGAPQVVLDAHAIATELDAAVEEA